MTNPELIQELKDYTIAKLNKHLTEENGWSHSKPSSNFRYYRWKKHKNNRSLQVVLYDYGAMFEFTGLGEELIVVMKTMGDFRHFSKYDPDTKRYKVEKVYGVSTLMSKDETIQEIDNIIDTSISLSNGIKDN